MLRIDHGFASVCTWPQALHANPAPSRYSKFPHASQYIGSPSLPMAMPFPAIRPSPFWGTRLPGARDGCDGRDDPDEPDGLDVFDACRLSWCDTMAAFVTTKPLFTRFSSILAQSSQYTPAVAGFPQIVQ
jgi:hypothetical protein